MYLSDKLFVMPKISTKNGIHVRMKINVQINSIVDVFVLKYVTRLVRDSSTFHCLCAGWSFVSGISLAAAPNALSLFRHDSVFTTVSSFLRECSPFD